MEQAINRHDLVPFEGQNDLLPVATPGWTLELPAPKKRGLSKWTGWLVGHPVARLGLATVAIAAGAYLSRTKTRQRPMIPSRVRRRNFPAGELTVTGVGLSIQSNCQQVSIWSILFWE